MIEFKEGNHYICLAFVSWDDGDWLAVAWREEETGKVRLTYRFRDSEDTKHWYNVHAKSPDVSDAKIIRLIESIMGGMASRGATVADLILIDGGVGAAMRALTQAPWAHVKKVV